jgi:hypothetical protein
MSKRTISTTGNHARTFAKEASEGIGCENVIGAGYPFLCKFVASNHQCVIQGVVERNAVSVKQNAKQNDEKFLVEDFFYRLFNFNRLLFCGFGVF